MATNLILVGLLIRSLSLALPLNNSGLNAENMKLLKIGFLLSFIAIQTSCCLKVQEISNSQLITPLATQTVPPPLYYYGSIDGYDYFSSNFCKYKVYKSAIDGKSKTHFISWDKQYRTRIALQPFALVPYDKGNR